MPPTTILTAPALDAFTTLEEHEAQTPTTFFGAKPVLHYHIPGARALAPRSQISNLPFIAEPASGAQDGNEGEEPIVETVEVFVSSGNFTIFNRNTSRGLEIPYPNIALHAVQRLSDPSETSRETQGLYMQLELSDPALGEEDEEPEIIELTILPPTSTDSATNNVQALFEAVSNCSNLHPDPVLQGDEGFEDGDGNIIFQHGGEGISGLPGVIRGATDGGLPPPMPGSGGWITAENVGEYFDEQGNWIGEGAEEEPLGEGAGRIRVRGEADNDEAPQVNGNGRGDGDENKRPRTE